MAARGMRVVAMGDDTWAQLAPASAFAALHPFPAFDVRDLHTVDDGVWRHLMPLIRSGSSLAVDTEASTTGSSGGGSSDHAGSVSDGEPASSPGPGWDVLVAHYLGVDHAGHTYGGSSNQMYDKLAQMDEQIVQVAEELLAGAQPGGPYSRTLLLVLGDHGQTMSGDHGGGSDEERDSVLLAWHVGGWRAQRDARATRVSPSSSTSGAAGADPGRGNSQAQQRQAEAEPANSSPGVDKGEGEASAAAAGGPAPEPMPQIDLTPSLALLLGLPIPHGNLGRVSRRLWALAHGSDSTPNVTPPPPSPPSPEPSSQPQQPSAHAGAHAGGPSYLAALRANAVQVGRYLRAYAARAGLPGRALARCEALLRRAAALHTQLSSDRKGEAEGQTGPEAVAEAEAAFEAFLEAAGALARRVFTRFDLPAMALGCILALGCVGLHAWALARACSVGVLLRPVAGVGLAGSLTLAVGLFGANWVQGEGRITCLALGAATLLLWLRAATAADEPAAAAAASSAPAASGAAGGGGGGRVIPLAAAAARPAAAAAAGAAAGLPQAARKEASRAGAGAWGRLRRQASLAAAAAVALAANAALQRYSLIDRWGADPHDKRQLAAANAPPLGDAAAAGPHGLKPDADGAGTAAGQAGWRVGPVAVSVEMAAALEVAVPLVLLPLLLSVLRRLVMLSQPVPPSHPGQAWLRCRTGGCWRLSATAQALTTTWWALQQWGGAGGAFLTLQDALRWGAGAVQALLPAPLVAWAVAIAAPVLGALGPAAAALGLQLPLRLLLPRVVYALAAAAVLRPALLRASRYLSRSGALRSGGPRDARPWAATLRPKGTARAAGQEEEAEEGGGAVQAEALLRRRLLGAACGAVEAGTAVLALLLGRRGPAVLLLLWAQGGALLGLLAAGTRTPAEGQRAASQGAAGAACRGAEALERDADTDAPAAKEGPASLAREPAQAAAGPAGTEPGVAEAVAAGCLLSAAGAQAFFLSGHFCEFSGLQYDSPFVGFDRMAWAATPALFWLNSFGGITLAALAAPLAAAVLTAPLQRGIESRRTLNPDGLPQASAAAAEEATISKAGSEQSLPPRPEPQAQPRSQPCLLGPALLALSAGRCASLAVCVLSAAVQRHHVAAWALFAPKLVFEVCFAAAAQMGLALAAPGLER
ncbi:hypothetical protein HYH03_001309 [Edaphochlamys debaryana]|uniref:GPI ethanolamine phosphate transferase 3 n=1 Tax=Edaphochlamys debaryana TaxID=47281 RepID=A0A836C6B0_9CHLO|nr:hypothetical protein HYH03_001309 [Edaphochlamys debaryana]|eukprot:KAG2500532.1 hypothetical protein HYH03_001309 [Edaphochlamys debaryana]